MVQASRGMLVPASPHLRSEPWIVAHMARATLGDKSVVPWEWLVEDYSRIRDKIEAVFPIFQGFNARIKVPGGFIWPTPQASGSGRLPTAGPTSSSSQASMKTSIKTIQMRFG